MWGISAIVLRALLGVMTQSSLKRPVALITGASGGIGRELATCFADANYDLVLVARTETKLQEVARDVEEEYGVSGLVLPFDLTDPGAATALYEELAERTIAVDVLVNNAGVGVYGPFADTDGEAELAMLRLNVLALTQLTKLAVTDMKSRGEGKILNVSSLVGFQPFPRIAVYAASKAYVLSFTDALAEELRGTEITVTALCAGPTDTDFFERADMTRSKAARGAIDPETVARAGFDGLMRGRVIVVPDRRTRLLIAAGKVTPRGIRRRIGGWVVAEA